MLEDRYMGHGCWLVLHEPCTIYSNDLFNRNDLIHSTASTSKPYAGNFLHINSGSNVSNASHLFVFCVLGLVFLNICPSSHCWSVGSESMLILIFSRTPSPLNAYVNSVRPKSWTTYSGSFSSWTETFVKISPNLFINLGFILKMQNDKDMNSTYFCKYRLTLFEKEL